MNWTKEQLEKLYNDDKMSLRKIARLFGTDGWTVSRAFKRFGIARRLHGPSPGTPLKEKVCGRVQHYRIQALFGKPKYCEECGTTDPSRKYDWANTTGDYNNPLDYVRLCRKCHNVFDKAGT